MGNISVGQRLKDLRADLMIEVVTQDDGGDLVRGFRAIDTFIDVCTKLERALLPSAAPALRPVAVLEDSESRSVIAWLRLERGQDGGGGHEAIEYVIGGIVESARWLSNYSAGADFQGLLRSLKALSAKSPRLPQPDPMRLLRAICELQEARASLAPRDHVLFVAEGGGVLLDSSSLVPTAQLLRSAARWHLKNDAIEMLLVVRTPDYSGGNIWRVQHDGAIVEVSVHDRAWLEAFTNRKIDVREGDVLRAVAITEQHYAVDGALLDAEIRITSIRETFTPTVADPATTALSTPMGEDTLLKFVIPSSSCAINFPYSSPATGRKAHAPEAPT